MLSTTLPFQWQSPRSDVDARRRCENGKLVPVVDPDWIKFSLELEAAGKAAYKAAQTRNQDTISDSTNQLNDSCMNCHRVYRGRTHCIKS
jgi:hypothetical protein